MSSARKKIAIVTATRAEYGLLSGLIAAVDRNPKLELQLFVTGAHLSQEQGMTVQQIEADGWPIAEKIPILPESKARFFLKLKRSRRRFMVSVMPSKPGNRIVLSC